MGRLPVWRLALPRTYGSSSHHQEAARLHIFWKKNLSDLLIREGEGCAARVRREGRVQLLSERLGLDEVALRHSYQALLSPGAASLGRRLTSLQTISTAFTTYREDIVPAAAKYEW